MTATLAVARYTLLEMLRRKMLWVFGIGGVVLVLVIGLVITVAPHTPGTPFSQSPGILLLFAVSGVVSFFSFLTAIGIGATALSHDLNSGSVVSIFSKPVSRLEYAAGKILAAVAALLALELILAAGTQALLLANGGGYEDIFVKLVASVAANQLTIMFIILAFSALVNNIVAVVIGVLAINLSNFLGIIYSLPFDPNTSGRWGVFIWAVRVLHWILPRNIDYNVSLELLRHDNAARAAQLAGTPGFATVGPYDVPYWLGYCVLLCAGLYLVVRRKQV